MVATKQTKEDIINMVKFYLEELKEDKFYDVEINLLAFGGLNFKAVEQ